ncbi:conserved hypothetical protein [Tenacibaculum litopenaei]|uniref:hypothetical protein n=1 Tax=Tenacibaculum litopenaei TaxID=396016 RepID=UPI0038965D02
MKKIENLGSALTTSQQRNINGGNGGFKPGCYEYPDASVDCISPWVYIEGCGMTCKIRYDEGGGRS